MFEIVYTIVGLIFLDCETINLFLIMALLNTITRNNLHECILTNSITIQEKKKIVLNYVLNVLKINKDNDVQVVVEEVMRCLASSFFNR